MTGHFEKGKWIQTGISIVDTTNIPLYIELALDTPCSEQVDRVANLLDLKPVAFDDMNGEMVIKGAVGNCYRILDFWEYLLKRVV